MDPDQHNQQLGAAVAGRLRGAPSTTRCCRQEDIAAAPLTAAKLLASVDARPQAAVHHEVLPRARGGDAVHHKLLLRAGGGAMTTTSNRTTTTHHTRG